MRQLWPKKGDYREVTHFLWFPKTLYLSSDLDEQKERRWLERATWIEQYDLWWEAESWIEDRF